MGELRIRPVVLLSSARTGERISQPHRKNTKMARRATSSEKYQSKITNDNGIARAKVPSPLLRDMGAKPGHYVVFKKTDAGVLTEVKKKKR